MIFEADRVPVTCAICRGEGSVERREVSFMDARHSVADSPYGSKESSVEHTVVSVACDHCNGNGFTIPQNGERVNVVQAGRTVGSCTIPATIKPHPLVYMRRGDYTPKIVDGKMIYEANEMLGPGDIEQLVGYGPRVD